MIKITYFRHIVTKFAMIAILVVNLFVSSCADNVRKISANSIPGTPPITQPDAYHAPGWWNGKDCNRGSFPAAYDLLGYSNNGNPITWRGIEVCGPIPGLNSTGPLEDFHDFGAGADQYMFQCTELIARYLWIAYNVKSQVADGSQIVDAYTNLQNTPFHKIVNDGNTSMAPEKGDVLSYEPTSSNPHGHTSIVTNSNVETSGSGTINVIQQNISWGGTAEPAETLNVHNWVIQASSYGAGSISSWMTTRSVSSQLPVAPQSKTYNVVVDSRTPPPGVDTGITLAAGDQITITAQGWATFGSNTDSTCDTSSDSVNIRVNPDGLRENVGGRSCPPRMSPFISYPNFPIGELVAVILSVGTDTSQTFFAVGSSYSGKISMNGHLYLLFNDGYYTDNIGQYQVKITV